MYGINDQLTEHASVNMFKNRIDKYLVKARYTWNKGRLHVEQYE